MDIDGNGDASTTYTVVCERLGWMQARGDAERSFGEFMPSPTGRSIVSPMETGTRQKQTHSTYANRQSVVVVTQ